MANILYLILLFSDVLNRDWWALCLISRLRLKAEVSPDVTCMKILTMKIFRLDSGETPALRWTSRTQSSFTNISAAEEWTMDNLTPENCEDASPEGLGAVGGSLWTTVELQISFIHLCCVFLGSWGRITQRS